MKKDAWIVAWQFTPRIRKIKVVKETDKFVYIFYDGRDMSNSIRTCKESPYTKLFWDREEAIKFAKEKVYQRIEILKGKIQELTNMIPDLDYPNGEARE